jgi:hypothetical protein
MGDDEDLTHTIEEQLAEDSHDPGQAHDPEQTQPLSAADLKDPAIEPLSDEQLQEENAETSLDQPSDSTS